MGKRPLDKLKEKFLWAIHKGIVTTEALMLNLKLKTKKFQTISGYLLDHKYIDRPKRGVYRLLPLGEDYVTTWLEPLLVVPFGGSKVQDFLIQFPEPYQGTIRLAVCAYIAKQSAIFNQEEFDGAFPGTVLIGDPGIGKTPIGEAVCRLQGLKFKDHKIDVEAITKGEFGGRSIQVKGSKFTFNVSYWFKLGYLQIEEPGNIVNREKSNLVRFILHGDKTYKRESGDIDNRVVPFATLNLPGAKKAKTVMEKIVDIRGFETTTIKRNTVLFCNPYRAYLRDPYEFFGRVMKDIPAIDLNFPVVKLGLNSQEKKLLIKLVHRAIKPNFEYSCCDKRGLEIQILALHALLNNKDITSAIYQVTRDRLQTLESLNLVRPGWRNQFDRERLEYEGVANPERADAIRKAIARQEGLEDSIVVIDIPGIEHGKAVDVVKAHGEVMDKLRKMRDTLDFPLTSVKEGFLPKYLIVELCKRYKHNNEGLRGSIQAEIEVLGKAKTEDNVKIGIDIAKAFWKELQPIETAFKSDVQRQRDIYLQGLGDIEIKKDVVEEIQGLITDLWKGEEWQSAQVAIRTDTTKKIYKNSIVIGDTQGRAGERRIRAIRELREVSKKLRTHLGTIIKSKANKSLPFLKQELREATYKSRPWLDKYERDIQSGWDQLFYGKDKPKPPTTPEEPPFNERPFDQERDLYKGKDSEELLKSFGYGGSESEQPREGLDKNLRKKGIVLSFLLIAVLVLVIVYFVFLRRPLETDTSIEGQIRDFDEMR